MTFSEPGAAGGDPAIGRIGLEALRYHRSAPGMQRPASPDAGIPSDASMSNSQVARCYSGVAPARECRNAPAGGRGRSRGCRGVGQELGVSPCPEGRSSATACRTHMNLTLGWGPGVHSPTTNARVPRLPEAETQFGRWAPKSLRQSGLPAHHEGGSLAGKLWIPQVSTGSGTAGSSIAGGRLACRARCRSAVAAGGLSQDALLLPIVSRPPWSTNRGSQSPRPPLPPPLLPERSTLRATQRPAERFAITSSCWPLRMPEKPGDPLEDRRARDLESHDPAVLDVGLERARCRALGDDRRVEVPLGGGARRGDTANCSQCCDQAAAMMIFRVMELPSGCWLTPRIQRASRPVRHRQRSS